MKSKQWEMRENKHGKEEVLQECNDREQGGRQVVQEAT
jgi:hypothetical protein